MLHLFRRYQKIIFFCITAIIIFTFVFFGTYQVLMPIHVEENETPAYVTVDGKKMQGKYMDQLLRFLKKEGMLSRDFFDSNFLSERFITHELIQTGVAKVLFAQDPEAFRQELTERLTREKNYIPYQHPYAKDISAHALWSLFAPDLEEHLKKLQGMTDPVSPEAIEVRLALYEAQNRFPPQFLANMLRYQERDRAGIPADPKLQRGEIVLFGYHDLEEWFGPTFITRAAELVVEMAAYARKNGYRVTREEAQAEMAYKSAQSLAALREQGDVPADMTGTHLLQLFMRHTGFEEKTLTRLYSDLMLCRQLLQDVSSSVLLDTLPFENFYSHAGESVTVQLQQMPKSLRFSSYEELKEFETYRLALRGEGSDPLLLPTVVHPLPELTGTRYRLYVGTVDTAHLEARVSVKETWRWEQEHWTELQQEFAWLRGEEKGIEALDSIDARRRAAVDGYARAQIVALHPEWRKEALAQAEMKLQPLFLTDVGARCPFIGITNVEAWKAEVEAHDELTDYSQDGVHFYRMLVLEREKESYVTFVEAQSLGILPGLQQVVSGEQEAQRIIALLRQQHPDVSENEIVAYRFEKQLKEPIQGALTSFMPLSEEITLSRSEAHFLNFDQINNSEEGYGVAQEQGAYHYSVETRLKDQTLPLDKMLQANELVAIEVRRDFLTRLCTRK